MGRRVLARRTACAAAALAFPWFDRVSAAPAQTGPQRPLDPLDRELELPAAGARRLTVPRVDFAALSGARGVSGPFGRVELAKVESEELPVIVEAHDGSAKLDVSGRSISVRYGTGSGAIVLGTAGVTFGTGKPAPWDAATVSRLFRELAADQDKSRGALLLRSTLQTSYPVAAAREGAGMGKRMASSVHRAALGMSKAGCTTRTVSETVTRTITETIAVVKTAQEQYQECFDRETSRRPCESAGPLAGVCAAGLCAAQAFIDMVVRFVDVVVTVAEQVTRDVVTCTAVKLGEIRNPFTLGTLRGAVDLRVPTLSFDAKTIKQAKKLLGDLVGFLGPFGQCLVGGEWSIAEADLGFSGGEAAVPYGVRVCISSRCASKLTPDEMLLPGGAAWKAAMELLASLSPSFKASVAALGIAPPKAILAAAAAVPELVSAAAAVILGVVILAMLYGTAISAQLAAHELLGSFDDGTVCIEHPSFALGLIKIATVGFVPSELIPPIVTG